MTYTVPGLECGETAVDARCGGRFLHRGARVYGGLPPMFSPHSRACLITTESCGLRMANEPRVQSQKMTIKR
jgi:hypothetical protein